MDGGAAQRADASPDGAQEADSAFASGPDAGGPRLDLGLDDRGPPQTCLATRTPASRLSQTGCFAGSAAAPVASAVPFSVLAPLWSDGAEKARYLAIPDATTIEIESDGDFLFPVGSVLLKTFTVLGRKVETRLMMQVAEDDWSGVTYLWNDAQTDATLLEAGQEVEIVGQGRSQSWTIPSREQCFTCHQAAAGHTLGLELGQLDFPMLYPATGRTRNQLATLRGLGVLAAQREGTAARTLVAPSDDTASIEARARSYLHANCSGCHRTGSSASFAANFLAEAPLTEAGCDVTPKASTFGIEDARIIAPSAPQRSVLLERMRRVASHLPGDARILRMPPLGVPDIDVAGLAAVESWIADLTNCEPAQP